MDAWVEWVTFLRGLHGLRGSKHFLRGSTFFVGQNFHVGCVDQNFLRGSVFFMWFKIFLHVSKFLVRHFWGIGSKEISTLSLQYFAYFFGLHYVQAAKLQVKVN